MEIDDDEEFKLAEPCMHIASTSRAIQKVKVEVDEDEEFLSLLSTADRRKKYHISDNRSKCKIQAARLKLEIRLFDRIPMWVFRYFAATDPLCRNDKKCERLEIMCVFMIINNISPALMVAFYMQSGQCVNDCMKLLSFFTNMKALYNKTAAHSLWTIFGNTYTIHLETRTMRQIDMTLVQSGSKRGEQEPFIMDHLHSHRDRMLRKLIRQGKFTIFDEIGLNQVKQCWRNGLQRRGRNGKNIWYK